MNNKNILLFGSNGLVGSSVKKLFETDENVNLIAATRNDADLFDFESTKNIIKNNNPEIIINSAAKVGGIYANNKYRTDFLLNNLKININILEACIGFPDIKIINLGSSCIYPLNAPNPIKETSFLDGKLEETNSPYAIAKITAIELGKSLNLQFGNKVINLMPTNLYGPRDNFSDLNSHVIPGLLQRIHNAKSKNEDSVDIWGSGSPLREFMYVDDLADAIKYVISNNIEHELLNVGSGEEISIKSLAELISEIVGFNGNLIFDSSMPDGNPRKLLDSTLINNLGWSAKTSLEKGLKLTYDWYVKNIT
jgi:GDP-L-fucose synthase|tara:strand:+ start:1663 stop:2589 length:927 start_codon:yes stop_codon:yes gene_type:complete